MKYYNSRLYTWLGEVLSPKRFVQNRRNKRQIIVPVSLCHRGGRMENINAWYLNTHMVYL
jgi:hypothetical protein